MNNHVVYYSKSGHSKAIAGAVADALSLQALDLGQIQAPLQSDLLFLITGIYGGVPDPKVVAYVESLSPADIKRVCLITSSMGENPQTDLRTRLESKGIPVQKAEYTCKGSFLLFGRGHPNKEEIREAADFARRTAASVGSV